MTTGPTEPVLTKEVGKEGQPEQGTGEISDNKATSTGVGVLMAAGISTLCAMVVTTLGIVGYMKFVDVGTRIGVVNIENVMETKQAHLALMVFGKETSEAQMGEAYDDAHRFGDRLHEALKTAEKECDCLLLTSAAIIQGNTVDMTERVKELAGLSSINLEAAKAELEKRMRFTPSIFGQGNPAQGTK